MLYDKEERESWQYVGPDSKTSPLRATQHKTEHTYAHMLTQTDSVGRMYVHQSKDGCHWEGLVWKGRRHFLKAQFW